MFLGGENTRISQGTEEQKFGGLFWWRCTGIN